MEEDIKTIQNTLWAMYKAYSATFDMREYNISASALVTKYKENPAMLNFCQNLIISWAPVINVIGEKHRKETQDG